MTESNPNITLESLFHVGDYVVIDNITKGWIVGIEGEGFDMSFKVKYELTDNCEDNIGLDRISVSTIPDTTPGRHATRSTANSSDRSSINYSESDNAPTEPITNHCLFHMNKFHSLIRQAYSFKPYKVNTNMQLYSFLMDGVSKAKGWVREFIQDKDVDQKTFLTDKESHLLAIVGLLFSGYSPRNGSLKGFNSSLCHAFGVTKPTLRNVVQKFIHTDYSMCRSSRKDKGNTIFNCEKKRMAQFTAYNSFKKQKLSEFRETTEKIPEAVIKSEVDTLPVEALHAHEILAQRDLDRAEFLWEELKDLLLKTKGKISYKCMSDQLNNIVSPNTIRDWLNQQEGFRLRKDRILPALDTAAKLRRLIWTHSFWMFWLSAQLIPIEKAIMVLIHMDKKWFYAIRTRCNTKVCTSIGLEPADYYCHHKNHIGKEMYICATAFVLTQDNDITKGGVAVPIAMVRVGKMVQATKDSYKRVYKSDGTYHYPKIDSNRLRKQGKFYFKSMELTGSSEGTNKKPKISLLKVYQDEIIPSIERKVVERFSNGGTRKVEQAFTTTELTFSR